MIHKISANTLQLIQQITPETNLPLTFSLFIEFCSNIQVISLALLPLLQSNLKTQNKLVFAINEIFSKLKPFELINPFGSNSGLRIALLMSILYMIIHVILIMEAGLKVFRKRRIAGLLAKILRIGAFIHSKILFFLIHCLATRVISGNCFPLSGSGEFSACSVAKVSGSVILLIVNLTLGFFHEFLCFQIHQNTQSYGIKNNLHNISKLFHKTLVLMFFYFIGKTSSDEVMIVFNIIFTIHNILVLQIRLPFYNITVLKLSTACGTISLSCAFFALGKYLDARANVLLAAILIIPFVVKISVVRLKNTVKGISMLKYRNCYQAVHFPTLLADQLKDLEVYSNKKKLNKKTLYSMGFLLINNQSELQCYLPEDIRKTIFQKGLQDMLKMLDKYPKNELLILSIAQMYIQIMDDGYTALTYINKLGNNQTSFAAKVSIQSLSNHLMILNNRMSNEVEGKEKKRASHYNYFACRHKTQILKKYIQEEIQQHLKFWRNLNNTEMNILNAIHQVSHITSQVHTITSYWTKNFEGQEILYVNASIIYALYLEVVRAIPSGGSDLLRKAQQAINNKWHIYRDVIDVSMGNSAVIVASIESDKIGRIIDTSASVKEMFKTSKQTMIGSNIGMVLPNVIAAKHNDFIRAYQKNSKEAVNYEIKSYAKTLADDYFKVEVSLHPSPLIYKELSIFAFIKKTSDFQSLLIVDHKGLIIDYSKDLSLAFNLSSKKGGALKIETLCPKFKLINPAFNLLYKSNDNGSGGIQSSQIRQSDDYLVSPIKSSRTDNLISPTTTMRPLNMNSTENDVPLSTTNRKQTRFLFNEQDISTTTRGEQQPNITIEDAQRIWDQYKGSNEFGFLPYNSTATTTVKKTVDSISSSRKIGTGEIIYYTKIEPFCFDGKWYQIIRLKTTKHFDSVPTVKIEPKKEIIIEPKKVPEKSVKSQFADNFPEEEEKSNSDDDVKNQAETLVQTEVPEQDKQSVECDSKVIKEDDVDFGSQLNLKRYTSHAPSKSDLKLIQRAVTRKLQSLKVEQQSKSSRMISIMFLFTIACIICTIWIHYFYTSQSLEEMQESNNLTQLVNVRLSKTILLWQAMLILYARSCKLRPIDYRVPKYQQVTINASLDVLKNAKELAEEVDRIANRKVVRTSYAKTVSLFEPHTHHIFNDGPVDQFSANQVLQAYYLSVARYNGSYLDLVNDREMLFAVNNTGNDYLLTLDNSINYISNFFQKTKNENRVLLEAIAVIEILVIVVPVVLVLVTLAMLIKKYSKLFETLSVIKNKSLEQRLIQLEGISKLFQESIEEDISSYLNHDNFHNNNNAEPSIELVNRRTSIIFTHREYRIRSLIFYILKYVLLAVILTTVVIVLVVLAFHKSTQNLDDLDALNQKALVTYHVKSQFQMLLPSFYMTLMFYNQSSYKVRNEIPLEQLMYQYEVLGTATNTMLSAFKDENNEVSDPVIKDIFAGKACKYVTNTYYTDCLVNTQGESFGLFGLHSVYADACSYMKIFATTSNPTFQLAQSMSSIYASKDPNTRLVIFDLYDYISSYLVQVFDDTAERKRSEMLKVLVYTLIVALTSLGLIGVIVLAKLKLLDLGVRRILRVIPERIVKENKILSFYVSNHFKNELGMNDGLFGNKNTFGNKDGL